MNLIHFFAQHHEEILELTLEHLWLVGISTLLAVLIGIPLGIGLFLAANGNPSASAPPAGWIAAAALGTLVVVAALTTIPARIGIRKSPSEALGQEA